MTASSTSGATRRDLRGQWIAAQMESARRAAECAAVGLLWTAFSLPLVTSGAAWLAAATVFDAWSRDEEPPLIATFRSAMRTQLRAGLLAEFVVAGIACAAYFDIRFAGAAHVPGAPVEMFAVGLLAVLAIGLIQVAAADRARVGGGVRASLRHAVELATVAPWLLPGVAVATAICVALVAIVPALILLIVGPLTFAVSVLHTRAAVRLDGGATDVANDRG